MVRSKSFVTFIALVIAVSVLWVAPAAAADRTPLDLSGFFELEYDEANGVLYLSQGAGSSAVIVTDLSGNIVTEIQGLTDATGITLSEDGASLWVALPTLGSIARIDTTSLAEVQRYALPTGVCPGSVAETDGYVAVGHSCNTYAGTGGYGSVGVLDPASGVWSDLGTGPFYRPYVTSSPGSPGLVVAGDLGSSPTTLTTIGIVDGIPDVVSSRWNTGGNLRDLAMSPDGQVVVQASGAPYTHNAYTPVGLADAGSYTSTNYPNAVAWSADGSTVATGTDSPYDFDVRLHAAGSSPATAEYELAPYRLLPRGLAVSGDGSIAFAVSGDVYGDNIGLHVLPGLIASTVEVVGTASVTVGHPVTLTGRLSFADGSPASGRSVEVRKSYADVDQLVGYASTDETGSFEIVDVPTVATTTSYTFSFAAAPPYASATGTTTVTVSKRSADLSISFTPGSGKGKNRTEDSVTATLGTTYTNRAVTITATPEGGSPTVIASGNVDAQGNLTTTYSLSATTTFVATFDGDAWYNPVSAETTAVQKKGGGKGRR